jgi:hypothetical protein
LIVETGTKITLSDGTTMFAKNTVNITAHQSLITKITALQVIDDDVMGSGSYLGVFGTNAGGVPYFAIGALSGSPMFDDSTKTDLKV